MEHLKELRAPGKGSSSGRLATAVAGVFPTQQTLFTGRRAGCEGGDADLATAICLIPSPEWEWPKPYLTAEPKSSVHPRYGALDSGFVCLGDSAVDPELLSFTWAGYGVVAVDQGGNIEGSLYGPLPHPPQMAGC
eukprot:2191226-Pyramimonas_sp.AAC.1